MSLQRSAGPAAGRPPAQRRLAGSAPAPVAELPVARQMAGVGASGAAEVGRSSPVVSLASPSRIAATTGGVSSDDSNASGVVQSLATNGRGNGHGPTAPGSPTEASPVVQRQDDGASPPPDLPTIPTDAGSASGPPAGGAGGGAPSDLDELSRRLYDRLRDRLRSELRLDRERVGRVVDDY